MPPNLTQQQSQAVACREVSIVLSSGAGCGKTHVLTERFLWHLRHDQAEVGQIVAITFTDRAARQMRERIRQAVLHELHTAQDNDQIEKWARHLRGLELAQISTIHAFCAALLRQHALQAGLDPHFDVLDEALAANFRTEAYAACLPGLLTSASVPGEDLRTLVLLYGWRPMVAGVEHLGLAYDQTAWTRWLERPPEEVARTWKEDERRALLPRQVAYLIRAQPEIARCLALLRSLPCLKPAMQANVRRLLEETPRLAETADLAAAVEQLVEAAKVGKDRAKAWPSEGDYATVKKAFEAFRQNLPRQLELFTETPQEVGEAVKVGQRFLRVAQEAAHHYQLRKRRAGAVDFQDLLFMARSLLRDQAEVREALQRRYRFLLVDELQDTDPIQKEVVEYLCGGELTGGKFFGVGDFKQSIYRFRGAEVRIFQELRQSMPPAGRLGLTVNFRSQPALLHFTNALFAPFLPDYEPLQPHFPQVNPGSCLEFLWNRKPAGENASQTRIREAEGLARRIAAFIGQERLVAVHGPDGSVLRPVQAGDIVLLFRSMSNVALYEAALRRHELDYYLVGGRAFYAQQEVYDVLNLLRVLENPQDAVSLAGTLRSPFCCLSDEALFLLSKHPKGLWAALQADGVVEPLPAGQRSAVAGVRKNLERWRSLKDRVPIAGLLNEVLHDSGYDAALQFEFLGDRKLANLWKLQELARTFDRSGLGGLADFIRRLGDLVRRQPREEQAATQPEKADVIRLMTIHQAKGLEFPVVIVPDLTARTGSAHQPAAHWDAQLGCVVRPPADEDPPPFSDFGWRLWKTREALDDWQEELRTFYVACTRAQDYLVLSGSLAESFIPETSWSLALAERFDLRQGTCLATGLPSDQVPKVQVVDPESLPIPSSLGKSKKKGPTPGAAEDPAPVQPIPILLAGKRLITVGELENFLARGSSSKTKLRPEEVAWQFDSEDGSDRRDWPRPGEQIRRAGNREEDKEERFLNDIFQRWDFRDPQGWKPLMEAFSDEIQPGVQKSLERRLARFAASDLRQELAESQQCHRFLEFLLESPHGENLLFPAERWVLRGLIDFCWEDTGRGIHLLSFDRTREKKDLRDRGLGKGFPLSLGLILGAVAVQQRTGNWPVSVTEFNLETGAMIGRDGNQLPYREIFTEVGKRVERLRELEFP